MATETPTWDKAIATLAEVRATVERLQTLQFDGDEIVVTQLGNQLQNAIDNLERADTNLRVGKALAGFLGGGKAPDGIKVY